jgi:hypothetical protein
MLSAQMLSSETDQASAALYFYLQIKHKTITKNYLKITINNSVLQFIFLFSSGSHRVQKNCIRESKSSLANHKYQRCFLQKISKAVQYKSGCKASFQH